MKTDSSLKTELIDIATFEHLVELAALELDSAQAEYIRHELNSQLNAIRELAAIPLAQDTPITSHGVPYTPQTSPALRPDEWQPYPDTQRILSQAPHIEDGYLIVPDIPHTNLE